MSKSILFLGHDASRTGAPRSLLNIASGLKESLGIRPLFLLQEGGNLVPEYRTLGPVIIWKDNLPNLSLAKRAWRRLFNPPAHRQRVILKQVSRQQPALVFSNTVLNGHILERLALPGVPVVSRIPELEYVIRLFDRDGSATKTFQRSHHLIAVSEAVRENLMRNHHIPESDISVIYGAVRNTRAVDPGQVERVRQQWSIGKDSVVVGACGTLIWRKGPDLFIRVAQRVKELLPDRDVTFMWVGGNTQSAAWLEYHRELELLGLDNVRITGEVDNTAAYYAAMDIFLMTSREDPFPLVNLEAARQGLPIICFDRSGGSVEFVTDEVGKVVPYGDTETMVGQLVEWILDADISEKKGYAAKYRAAAFTTDRMIQQIEQVVSGFLPTDG